MALAPTEKPYETGRAEFSPCSHKAFPLFSLLLTFVVWLVLPCARAVPYVRHGTALVLVLDQLQPAHPKRDPLQKRWLVGKFPLFLNHQAKKTLGQFFAPLYEEYFAKWPLVPKEEDVAEYGGDVAVALAKVQEIEEDVR